MKNTEKDAKNKKEKTTDIAKNALSRLSEGKNTINQIRNEFGLSSIEDELANAIFTKAQCDNNMEPD